MRIGAFLLYQSGWCYQSYAWRYMRSLGRLRTVIHALESYGVDEIAVVRPTRGFANDEVRGDLEDIQTLNCMTPITVGGGLRDKSCIGLLKQLPVERYVLNTAFLNADRVFLRQLCDQFGRQAIQAILPFRYVQGGCQLYHCGQKKYVAMSEVNFDFINEYANEVILHAANGEGVGGFTMEALETLPLDRASVICSGGVTDAQIPELRKMGVASVLLENRILHKEYSLKKYS